MRDGTFGPNTIRGQLMLSFMVTTGLALVLASAAYLVTEFYRARAGMVENIGVLAQMIGDNTAPSLLFNDESDAQVTLAAVQAQTHVMSAVLYDAQQQRFASYDREDSDHPRAPTELADGHSFSSDSLDLFEPIMVDGERVGTVFIRSDTQQLSDLFSSFMLIFAMVFLGSLGVCYIGASMLRDRIATPLGAIVEASARMAKGDLSGRVEVGVEGELASAADGFNEMMVSLRGLLGQVGLNTNSVADVSANLRESSDAMGLVSSRQEMAVSETADSIEHIHASIREVGGSIETLSHTAMETSTASAQMDASNAEIATHMDGLSESIDNTASSVVEMTNAIREIARNADELDGFTESTASALTLIGQTVKQVQGHAEETHTLSEKTAEQAQRGLKSVEVTVDGMREIQQSFQGLDMIIVNLSEKSDSIGEVIKVIEGVVEQTNLLALNAAIISSQAGEHGRAFAVVAEEVRNLAERTAGSTREISELVVAVQQGVGDAVTAMKMGGERVEKGVALSQDAGEILRLIGETASESSQRVHEIVGTTERQALDIDKVDDSMGRVKEIAAQLNQGTHEQDNASSEITRAVERMRDLGQRVTRSTEEQRKDSGLISQSVEIVATRIQQILEATNDQSKQGDQILEALKVFREVTHESDRRSQELRDNLEKLSRHSEQLEQEVGRFSV